MPIGTPVRATALLAALASWACVGGALLSSHESVDETRALDSRGRFELENVNGHVTVTTWSERRVRIQADKAATSAQALRDLRVEIVGEGSRIEVRTRQPRGFWLFGGGDKVDYRVTLPADARVRLQNVNGGVEIEGVSGELRASTVNGGVAISEAAGTVEASSVNGSITAAYSTLPDEGEHRFSTTNGSITVRAPEGTGGRLKAETVNGSVDNDLRLESTEHSSRHRLAGRLGQGYGSLELTTVNGSIHLRRR